MSWMLLPEVLMVFLTMWRFYGDEDVYASSPVAAEAEQAAHLI